MKNKYLINFLGIMISRVAVCGLTKPITHKIKVFNNSKNTLDLTVRVLITYFVHVYKFAYTY